VTLDAAPRPSVDAPTLCAVAAYGLAGSLAELPGTALDPDAWRTLLAGSRLQRMTGLLVRALHDGALPATTAQVEEATGLHVQAMSIVLSLERALADAATLLTAAGVPFRVLKGSASSHLDYADPSLRSFHDVDLLVPGDRLDATVGLLTAAGFARRYPAPRPEFDARFGKAVTLVSPGGAELDVHRTFALGPYGQRIRVADLWAGPGVEFELAGVPMRALDADLRLLNAAYHASLGDSPPRLVPLRDVVQLALDPRVDRARVRALAAAWQGEAVLAHALRQAWATLRVADVTALSTWAQSYRPRAGEDKDLAVYLDAHASYVTKSYAAVRGIPGLSARLAYLRALLLPSRSYVRGRHPGRLARLRRGAGALLSRAGHR
jgi:putative nucleotidyltransferase-like protein